jgi:hypothetical protein
MNLYSEIIHDSAAYDEEDKTESTETEDPTTEFII